MVSSPSQPKEADRKSGFSKSNPATSHFQRQCDPLRLLTRLSQLDAEMGYFSAKIGRRGAKIKEEVLQNVCSPDQVSSQQDI
jgi:hypothetical protein